MKKRIVYVAKLNRERNRAQCESKVFQLNFNCLQFNQCESSPTLYDPLLTMKDARALEEILTSPTSFHFGERAEPSMTLTDTVLQSPTISTTHSAQHQGHSHHHHLHHHQVLQQLSPNNLPNSHNNGMFDNGNNVYNLNVQVWIDQIFLPLYRVLNIFSLQQNFTQILHFEPNKDAERQSSSKSVYYPPAPEPIPYLASPDNLPPSSNAVRNLNSVFGGLPSSNQPENQSYLAYSGSYTATDAPLSSAHSCQGSPLEYFDNSSIDPLVIDESSASSEHSDILDDWFEKISDVLCKEFWSRIIWICC